MTVFLLASLVGANGTPGRKQTHLGPERPSETRAATAVRDVPAVAVTVSSRCRGVPEADGRRRDGDGVSARERDIHLQGLPAPGRARTIAVNGGIKRRRSAGQGDSWTIRSECVVSEIQYHRFPRRRHRFVSSKKRRDGREPVRRALSTARRHVPPARRSCGGDTSDRARPALPRASPASGALPGRMAGWRRGRRLALTDDSATRRRRAPTTPGELSSVHDGDGPSSSCDPDSEPVRPAGLHRQTRAERRAESTGVRPRGAIVAGPLTRRSSPATERRRHGARDRQNTASPSVTLYHRQTGPDDELRIDTDVDDGAHGDGAGRGRSSARACRGLANGARWIHEYARATA